MNIESRIVSVSTQLLRDRISKMLDPVPLKTDRPERVLPLDDVQDAILALAKVGAFVCASELGGPIET